MQGNSGEGILLALWRGPGAIKWAMFAVLVLATYSCFFFGLVLTIARIDGEFVGEV